MKRILLLLTTFFCCCTILYAQTDERTAQLPPKVSDSTKVKKFNKRDLIPKFTATVLGRYEFNTNLYTHHFELRHTRIGVYGNVHPMFSYMALVDLTSAESSLP